MIKILFVSATFFALFQSCNNYNGPGTTYSGTTPINTNYVLEVNCSGGVLAQTIDIRNGAFTPANESIVRDQVIKWENFEDNPHTVTSGTSNAPENKFDIVIGPQTSSSRERCLMFITPGTYLYYDKNNTNMRGQILVR